MKYRMVSWYTTLDKTEPLLYVVRYFRYMSEAQQIIDRDKKLELMYDGVMLQNFEIHWIFKGVL